MASILLSLALIFVSTPSLFPLALSHTDTFPTSTISAAPALLPNPPLSSPALSPDISPLFPSPGGSSISPSDSSMPIIPSSPSPPNPDAMSAPSPYMAFSPSGALPAYSSSSVSLHVVAALSLAMLLGSLSFSFFHLSGV